MPPAFDPNGKVALVTGAARGIGFEAARQLALRGASVAVVDLDPEQAREAAERIGERAIGIGADVTDEGAMRAAVAETVERFGGLDLAIANAGMAQAQVATVRGIAGEEWERVFEVDMLGVWRTVRAALPQIVERQGHIVVTGSIYSWFNGALNSPYAVAKAGVESLGRGLRSELIPLGASAGVVYYGWVDTRLVQDGFSRQHSDRMRENIPKWLLKRIQPDEAAAALIRGIEKRAPRTFAPRWWAIPAYLRGILNPLIDRRFERRRKMVETVRAVEASADEQGAAAVAAAERE
jgi:NAD(P)-dependent dehydrogenase (short-subunit alcohol dehydrogenase family)